jgi:bacillithiol biosynthesis cysteine-adding enzyme BshC
MQTEKISLDETDCFSPFFLDYLNGKKELSPFYQSAPTVEGIGHSIKNRPFSQASRAVLAAALTRQYDGLILSEKTKSNIDALRQPNAFTIVTGHQLNIFTGPLYFIYKIVTAINAAKTLQAKYPDQHFVPVYWMASEDHDFAEINHFNLHGKTWRWETAQQGAVGRMDPAGLKALLDHLPGDVSVFREAYLGQKTLADACRHYVNALFGEHGLVVVDADDDELKKLLIPVIEQDVLNHVPSGLVNAQTDILEALGYKSQVHCRPVNFFYLEDGLRARIEKQRDRFVVVDTDLSFSESEMRQLIQDHPERFSPNVVLRPLYQELILPNLAYIGGPAEMVYWLQLKTLFVHFQVPFPALLPRNFGVLITHTQAEKWQKTGLSFADLFLNENALLAKWVKANSNGALTFGEQLAAINGAFEKIRQQAEHVDITLGPHIAALQAQAIKRIHLAEKKLLRAEKRKHADRLGQVSDVKNTLFPNGSLQERTDNFMEFSSDHRAFISRLIEEFDPFDFRIHLLKV